MANSNTRATLRRIRQQKRREELGVSDTYVPTDDEKIYIIYGVKNGSN